MIRTVVFDFDGVLVESNAVKYEAFFRLFPDTDGVRRVLREVLERSREQTRYAILAEILAVLEADGTGGTHAAAGSVQRYARRYNDIVEEAVARCPEVPGAREAVEAFCAAGRSLYVNSTTPVDPLRRLLYVRGLLPFFNGIYGGEHGKKAALGDVLRREAAAPGEVLVVGDGESDREAAGQVGCLFVGVRNPFNGWSDREPFRTVEDLRGLRGALEGLERPRG